MLSKKEGEGEGEGEREMKTLPIKCAFNIHFL